MAGLTLGASVNISPSIQSNQQMEASRPIGKFQVKEEKEANNVSDKYRESPKGGPQVVWNMVKKLRFVYLLRAGERNSFT